MTAFVLAALMHLAPSLVVSEAKLAELVDAISEASLTKEEAMLLVSLAYWESGRSLDAWVGDHGHSRSVFQVWVCPGPLCERVSRDVKAAAVVAVERVRASVRRCARVPGADPLSEYTTGRCRPNREAKTRWRTARWLLGHVPGEA